MFKTVLFLDELSQNRKKAKISVSKIERAKDISGGGRLYWGLFFNQIGTNLNVTTTDV
jgi:hypothetical protein